MADLTVIRLSEYDFRAARRNWEKIAQACNADPLFMSWDWQWEWWSQCKKLSKAELYLLAIFDKKNKVAGFAPLYAPHPHSNSIFSLNSLQLLGSNWGNEQLMFSENLGILCRPGLESSAIEAFFSYLLAFTNFDHFILGWIGSNPLNQARMKLVRNTTDYKLSRLASIPSYAVDTRNRFEDWNSALGRNTRLRMFGRMKALKSLGKVEIYEFPTDRAAEFFSLLNDFHKARWNKPAFCSDLLDFNLRIVNRMSRRNRTRLSVLLLNGQPISVFYNLIIGNREYNLQQGYQENLHKKLSLGYIHLGLLLKNAFQDESIAVFDLLAGSGKNEDYKRRFAKHAGNIETWQLLRPGARVSMTVTLNDLLGRIYRRLS